MGRVGVSRQWEEEAQQGGQLQGKPGMMSLCCREGITWDHVMGHDVTTNGSDRYQNSDA